MTRRIFLRAFHLSHHTPAITSPTRIRTPPRLLDTTTTLSDKDLWMVHDVALLKASLHISILYQGDGGTALPSFLRCRSIPTLLQSLHRAPVWILQHTTAGQPALPPILKTSTLPLQCVPSSISPFPNPRSCHSTSTKMKRNKMRNMIKRKQPRHFCHPQC